MLRSAGQVQEASEAITSLGHRLHNASNGQGFGDVHRSYLEWVEEANSQLRSLFADDTLAEGLYGSRYHALLHLTGRPQDWAVMRGEMKLQADRLQGIVAKLQEYEAFAARPGEIVVVDTSAFVMGEFFEDFDWAAEYKKASSRVRLVVPIVVVEELDEIKDRDRNGKKGDRARRVLKRLRDLCGPPSKPGEPAPIEKRKNSTIEVFMDDEWHVRRSLNDNEIVHQALTVQSLTGRTVTLACIDTALFFRAHLRGLGVFSMPQPDELRNN